MSHRTDSRLRGLHHRPPIGIDQTFPERFAGWLEPARPSVKLMVGFGGRVNAGGSTVPLAWVGGLDASATTVGLEGTAFAAVDVELTPLGAYRVLGHPVSELGGGCVELSAALGPEGARLADRVAHARGWAERFAALDELLLQRLDRGARPNPAVERAWALLEASEGRMRIEAVAAELNVSRRHLAATFARETGLRPKTAARLMRFGAARRQMDAAPGRWGDVAFHAGYADQSHLNRDFREFAGVTPTEYLARHLPREDLPFVQDVSAAAA